MKPFSRTYDGGSGQRLAAEGPDVGSLDVAAPATRAPHRPRNRWLVACVAVPILWIAVFLAAPACLVLVYSFWTYRSFSIVSSWTFENYAAIPTSSNAHVLLFTVETAVIVVLCGLVVAYGAALFISRLQGRWASLLLMVMMLPFLTNVVVRIFAWRAILGREGLINSLLDSVGLPHATWLLFSQFSIVVVLLYGVIPFMTLPLYASMKRVDPTLFLAAENLGSPRWYTFLRVVLPMTKQGALVAVLLGFITASAASLEPMMVGGTSSLTWGQLVVTKVFEQGNIPEAAAFAFLLAMIVVAIIVVAMRVVRIDDFLPVDRREDG